MPGERVSMRQIREVLRLRFASELPQRGIAKSLGLSQGAVSGYLSRARAAGVSWPLPVDLDDEQLEALLFPPPPAIAADQRPMPDWAGVHRELRRPNVTLAAASPARSCLSTSPAALARSPKTCRRQHDQVPLLRFLILLTAQSAEGGLIFFLRSPVKGRSKAG